MPTETKTKRHQRRTDADEIKWQVINLIDGKLPNRYVAGGDLSCNSFDDWVKKAKKVANKDEARCVLYLGFQPLYDALVERKVAKRERKNALKMLDTIMQAGVDYLSSYYTGKHDISIIVKAAKTIEKQQLAPDCEFLTKPRNIDRNGIRAADIGQFIKTLADRIHADLLPMPDVVVGCACGSSEIVMPVAGLFGKNFYFIRCSHRRNDNDPRVVGEHGRRIAAAVKNRTVLCVDDYVCTGRSLSKIMKRVVDHYGAAQAIGAGINSNPAPNALRIVERDHKFHILKQRGQDDATCRR